MQMGSRYERHGYEWIVARDHRVPESGHCGGSSTDRAALS